MNGSPRSAALLSTVRPFPTDNGKSVVIAGFLNHLSERLGPSNVHYLHVGEPFTNVGDFGGIRVHEMGLPGHGEQLRGMVVDAGIGGRSLQEALTSSALVRERVRATLSCLAADVEVIDTVRMVQHVRGTALTGRRVLYLDDLFSVRYQRMLEVLERGDADFDPLGQFCTFVPERLRFLTQRRLPRRLLLEEELRRITRAEQAAAQSSDVCVLLSQVEAQLLSAETGARVEVLPPRLPQLLHAPARWTGRPDFAFVGLLSIPHNHDALTWFVRECLPRLLRRRPDARLHVIGRDASPELLAHLDAYPESIVQHGFVPDLDTVLGGMAGVINTLRFGSGLKIKALEALSRGIPVVATSVGAEGIVSHPRPGMTVADDSDGIVEALVRLSDPIQRALASEDAFEFYARHYSRDAVARSYDRVFGTRADRSMMSSAVEMNLSGEKRSRATRRAALLIARTSSAFSGSRAQRTVAASASATPAGQMNPVRP